jgi:hypothetical protein
MSRLLGHVERLLLLAAIHPAVVEFCESAGLAPDEVAPRVILPSGIAVVRTTGGE